LALGTCSDKDESNSHKKAIILQGRVEVFVKFSAKDGFGAVNMSIARCIFESDGKTLLDLRATKSR
jgi:hypothetical protein